MRICLHDKQQIESFLKQDPGLYLYLLGDLDDFFWPHTSWYGWTQAQLGAIALLYAGDELPVLLALGRDTTAPAALLQSLTALLPRRFYTHLSPGLESELQPDWSLSGGNLHYRMLQQHPERLQDFPCPEAQLLGPADLPALAELYATAYPDNWFNPRMLATGQYLGIYRQEQLQAVAGVHVYAPQQGVAALGNIAVRPESRGEGWGTRLTAALCLQLGQQVELIGLNVHAENTAALRCYQKLGFEIQAEYREWMAVAAREAGTRPA